MKDAPASMLNRLTWLLGTVDCALAGGVHVAESDNCPSAGVVYKDTKSTENANASSDCVLSLLYQA